MPLYIDISMRYDIDKTYSTSIWIQRKDIVLRNFFVT